MHKLIFIISLCFVASIANADICFNVKSKDITVTNTMIKDVVKVCELVPNVTGISKNIDITIYVMNEQDFILQYERTNSGKVPKAFYVPIEHTVYVNARYFKKGVLAHEITHALMDEYFNEPVPVKISEVVCEYVDRTVSNI